MDKKRKVKILLTIVLWLVMAIVSMYFITAFTRMKDGHVKIDKYYGTTFFAQDNVSRIKFNENATIAYVDAAEAYGAYVIDYSYNIFTLTSMSDIEDVHYFVIVDEQFIFGDSQYWICDWGA